MEGLTTICQFLFFDENNDNCACLSSHFPQDDKCRDCPAMQPGRPHNTPKQIEKFDNLYRNAVRKSNELNCAMQKLAKSASDMLGYDVVADISNGEEIEFRRISDSNDADGFDTMLYGDICEAYNKNYNRHGNN